MADDWQPIETAPTDGTPVLLFVPGGIDRPGYEDPPAGLSRIGLGWNGYAQERMGSRRWVVADVQTSIFQGSEHTGAWDEHEWTAVQPTHWMPLPEPPTTPA